MLRLRYQPVPDWPPLAWIARLPARGGTPAGSEGEVLVTHGSVVTDLTRRDIRMGEFVVLRREAVGPHSVAGQLYVD